ncbi:Ig-like domain-containing protein [Dyella sp.]|uniref:Ig-like domain-containing protein n=1 Tax=Dyella sp. TaxID=1869338 RepID=UPI003217B499
MRTEQAINVDYLQDDSGSNSGGDTDTDDGDDAAAAPGGPAILIPDVYPDTISLQADGTRQLKVHVSNPDTGVTIDANQPLPPGCALLYLSGDDNIATVSASGLITAQHPGVVTISVVYLRSETDIFGNIVNQTIGQRDIVLHVDVAQVVDSDAGTPAPQSVQVHKDEGAVVAAATGETVMIGAGVLAADTAVSIQRIDLASLQAATGMAAPAPSVLQALGAFHLDIGQAASQYPLQMAIPVQGSGIAQPGDEVLFLRRGTVMAPDGTMHDTWWLVDNGYVGADGVARTASPPYDGLQASGDYVVCRRLPGVIGSMFELGVGAGDWATFGGLGVSLAGGLMGADITSEMIGILASVATGFTAGSYHFGVPQFADIPLPQLDPGQNYSLDVSALLPPAPTVAGNIVLPNITDISYDTGAQKLHVNLDNSNPGDFKGDIVVRVLFPDGSHRDIQTLAGDANGDVAIDVPAGIAIGSVRWQLVRRIPNQSMDGSGNLTGTPPLEYAGNIAAVVLKPDMGAVLTRTGVQFIQENHVVGETNLLDMLGTPNDFDGTYLTGTKVNPIAFSGDLSRCYVGGNGVIYVIDMVSFRLIDTISTGDGKNITSLVAVGNVLIVGEGNGYGVGAGNNRLLAMDIDPGSHSYNVPVSIKGTGIEDSTYGVTGMALGADKKTLVVAVPRNPNSVMLGNPSKRGDVLILDLSTLDFATGEIAAPVVALLPGDGLSGKAPQIVSATPDPDRYLVSNVADYDRGLSTLTLTRDADGNVVSATMSAIDMSQPTSAIQIDRTNIQRAQSAVLVEQDGVEYAIVADDNYNFNDPYWKAMFEAPDFLFPPFGPPIAVGGSASAKKVAVGGKLGIVKDPFGKLGTPQYLGATLPLDGYGIINLTVSEDGRVLVGQLKGGFGTVDQNQQNPNQNAAWNVAELIQAALAMPDGQGDSKHIPLPGDAQQQIPPPSGGSASAPAGAWFDDGPLHVSTSGDMGDVIQVDVRDLVARQLLISAGTLAANLLNLPFTSLPPAAQAAVTAQMAKLGGFDLLPNEAQTFSVPASGTNSKALNLITQAGPKKKGSPATLDVVSRDANGLPVSFKDQGTLFLVPNLTQADEDALRAGHTVGAKSIDDLAVIFYVEVTGADGKVTKEQRSVVLKVTANDYTKASGTVLFGDRPASDPGYSAIHLSGAVGIGQKNDIVDVYRIEQRLKYLGYPALGLTTASADALQDFKVDGKFGEAEARALSLFEEVTAGTASSFSYSKNASINNGAALDWLNAYNAPHWMQFFARSGDGYAQTNADLPNWRNLQTDAGGAVFGTSWLFDLMVASSRASVGAKGNQPLLFDGSEQANLVTVTVGKKNNTSTNHLGANFKLGVDNQYISDKKTFTETDKDKSNQTMVAGNDKAIDLTAALVTLKTTPGFDLAAFTGNTWSYGNAAALTALLPKVNNTKGADNEQAALSDFLSVYGTTQNEGAAGAGNHDGSWEELSGLIHNGNASQAVSSLFGDGTQGGGLINASNVGLGGLGWSWPLTAESLAHAFNHSVDSMTPWVSSMNKMLTEFQINTPDRAAAFFAQVTAESAGLSLLIEDPGYSVSFILKAWGKYFQYSAANAAECPNQPVIPPNATTAQKDAAIKAAEQKNIEYFKAHHTADPLDLLDWVYSTDKGNGTSKGTYAQQTGRLYRGRGATQLTGWTNYHNFALYMQANHPDIAKAPGGGDFVTDFMKDPGKYMNLDSESGRFFLLAAGGWHWDVNHVNAIADRGASAINDVTLAINPGFAGNAAKLTERATIYAAVRKAIFEGGNSYSNMRLLLGKLGITTKVSQGGQSDFTIHLRRPASAPTAIAPRRDTAAAPADAPNGPVQSTSTQAVGTWTSSQASTGSTLDTLVQQAAAATTVASLDAGALGEEQGTAITLDDDGNGYGWYMGSIDGADDFLPTADPNVWIAKAGSAADGKMDMLSVLLHEYGHLLGFEHSPDGRDFMNATLQPGVRRLPTQAELAAMLQLAAQLKSAPASASNDSHYDVVVAPSGSTPSASATPAANAAGPAQALSGTLDVNNGWSSTGNVAIANGTATLGESTGTQTRISQSFIVTADEQFLHFTVSGVQLQNPGDMPEDAFEAALLDATTGASLGGAIGLSRTASMLNLQGDGSSYLGQGVSYVTNADGSRTYLVDLRGIAAGTAVNLSFDLLGFGPAGSHVTVSDVALMGLPQANDDLVQGQEDSSVNVNVLGNDVNAAGATPTVVTGPAHGTLTFNADGSFTYVPDALYYGNDSFTYLLDNGKAQSNLATVNLAIAHVNHAPGANDLTVTLQEDGTAIVDLRPLSSDVDGDALTYRIVNQPQHGSLTQNADGTYTYTPGALFYGDDSFTYVANDGTADSPVATVSLVVIHVNHAPIAINAQVHTPEEQAYSGQVLSYGTDVDGDPLTAVLVSGPQHGSLQFNADGSFTYTPDALYRGTDSFSYQLSDGQLTSAVATLTFTMDPVNHAPTVADLNAVVAEEGLLAIDPRSGASDVDGDALSTAIVSGPQHGTLTRLADGSYQYVPDALYRGDDSFSYKVNDGTVDSNVATVKITVTPINHAPTAANASATLPEDGRLTLDPRSDANDVDGDALTAVIVSGPAHGTLTQNADGSFTYVPDVLYRGSDSFSYKVNDGTADSNVATITLTVTPVNHAPTAQDGSATVAEDGAVVLDPRGNARDVDGDPLAVVIVSGPAHGALVRNADGSFTYTPTAYYAGGDSFTYKVNDGTADSNVATIVLTVTPVNHAPVAVNDTAATDQGVPVTIDVLANDSDIDNSTGVNAGSGRAANAGLTARIVSRPANGTLTVNADGTLTYKPNAAFSGTDSFSYVANDGVVDSALASVTITVRATNHAPVANDDTFNGKQGQPLNFNPLANDTDADGDALSLVLVSGPAHGTLTRNADGSLSYVSSGSWTGTDTLTYQASDGKSLSNVATVRLVVASANQAPVAANDTARVHNNQTANIRVLANDTDADGDALSSRMVAGPKHGTVVHNADGSFSYTADCGYTGTDTFTYVANDGKADSNLATVTITVLGPNLPPLAFDDGAWVNENGAVKIDPVANDWDINGDPLTARILCGPSHGSLALNADGTYTYTPDANWYGLDGFTYAANDGQFDSNPAMVWIHVAHVNQAPVANNDAVTARAGQATRIDVLANDSDVDGDSLHATLTATPKHGTLTRNWDGSFSYTAQAGFVGTDTFVYVADDGQLKSAPATVTITVLAPNHAPVARDDQATTNAGTPVRIDLLANDSDADGDKLAARIVCGPCHGTLSLNPDGSYTYTPNKGWYGTDSFSYRDSDGTADSNTAMVCITVAPVNHAPTARNASFQVQKDGSVCIDFGCLIGDVDGDCLTLTLGKAAHGTLTRNYDGTYTYRPAHGYTGTDGFAYTVSDGRLSATATVSLNVVANGGCWNGQSVMVAASAQTYGWSAATGGYIVVLRSTADSSAAPSIDWQGDASTAIGSSENVGSAWWNTLVADPLLPPDDLAAQSGLSVKRLN